MAFSRFQPDLTFEPNLFIRWVVEEREILVLDEPGQRSMRLTYPAAGIWELLMQGRRTADVAEMTAGVADIPLDEARQAVLRQAAEWQAARWIRPVCSD